MQTMKAPRLGNFGHNPVNEFYFEVHLTKAGAEIWEITNRRNLKVTVPPAVWATIADPVKANFNQRLLKIKAKQGQWRLVTQLDRLFGKELTLLAWAVEDATTNGLERAIANWTGLAPEERWWLYTTTNATSNLPAFGKNHGWRKAIRIALTEN
jgi:hypothetical protein